MSATEEPSAEYWPRVSVVDHQSCLDVSLTDIAELAEFTLVAEQATGRVEVALVDDATIERLHLQFMNISGPTDVITFDFQDDELQGPEECSPLLGEIVVSTETAIRQAPQNLPDPIIECLQYVVHGVLHLLGYDDKDPVEATRMAERQHDLLLQWQKSKEG